MGIDKRHTQVTFLARLIPKVRNMKWIAQVVENCPVIQVINASWQLGKALVMMVLDAEVRKLIDLDTLIVVISSVEV